MNLLIRLDVYQLAVKSHKISLLSRTLFVVCNFLLIVTVLPLLIRFHVSCLKKISVISVHRGGSGSKNKNDSDICFSLGLTEGRQQRGLKHLHLYGKKAIGKYKENMASLQIGSLYFYPTYCYCPNSERLSRFHDRFETV